MKNPRPRPSAETLVSLIKKYKVNLSLVADTAGINYNSLKLKLNEKKTQYYLTNDEYLKVVKAIISQAYWIHEKAKKIESDFMATLPTSK